MHANQFKSVYARDSPGHIKKAVLAFQDHMTGDRVALNKTSIERRCLYYAKMPPSIFSKLLEMSNMSVTAHLIVGFGNFTFRESNSTNAFSRLLRLNDSGSPSIPQTHPPEGDFHPWQGFAYASLAGMNPETEIPSAGANLRTLATNSSDISMQGRGDFDLGHLLMAASFIVPDPSYKFRFDGETITLRQVGNRALLGHIQNEESTCHHFHLTEGLCLASARIPGMADLRTEAAEFLNRQLDVLNYVAVVLNKNLSECEVSVKELKILSKLVGHAIELAAIAQICGFDLSKSQKNALNFVANASSVVFGVAMSPEHFSALAHYRRGSTLLLEIERARTEGRCLSTINLSSYSVNLDEMHRSDAGLIV